MGQPRKKERKNQRKKDFRFWWVKGHEKVSMHCGGGEEGGGDLERVNDDGRAEKPSSDIVKAMKMKMKNKKYPSIPSSISDSVFLSWLHYLKRITLADKSMSKHVCTLLALFSFFLLLSFFLFIMASEHFYDRPSSVPITPVSALLGQNSFTLKRRKRKPGWVANGIHLWNNTNGIMHFYI